MSADWIHLNIRDVVIFHSDTYFIGSEWLHFEFGDVNLYDHLICVQMLTIYSPTVAHVAELSVFPCPGLLH